MKFLTAFFALSTLMLTFACQSQKSDEKSDQKTDQTAIEKSPEKSQEKDWIVLFDGESLDKWKGFKNSSVPQGWEIIDKELVLTKGGAGDIITKEEFEDFELELDWKISEGGNSGIFYHIVEDGKYKNTYETAPEMQILDDEKHPDANQGKNGSRKAGSLYDMIPSKVKANPPGEWNKVKIIVNNGKTEFWLNGEKTVEFEKGSEEWKKLLNESKFKDWEGFAKADKGHIGLQDHGDKVFFRNIRIREL